MVVIGSGIIGLEMGRVLCRLGSEVTAVDIDDEISCVHLSFYFMCSCPLTRTGYSENNSKNR
jgi:hypothetical protein